MSHHHLLSQLDSLSAEVQECRTENTRLKEENEGWEYLVRERTFQGHLLMRDEFGSQEGDGRGRPLEALDEELESEMNDLHSELDVHSPPLDDEQSLSRTSTLGMGRGARRDGDGIASRQTSISASLDVTQEPTPGMDLAAELGRADPPLPMTAPASRAVSGVSVKRTDTADEEVHRENKRLKEEVKALQLYCSKVSPSPTLFLFGRGQPTDSTVRSSTGSSLKMGLSISSASTTRRERWDGPHRDEAACSRSCR